MAREPTLTWLERKTATNQTGTPQSATIGSMAQSAPIAVATAFLLSAIAGQAQTRVRTLRVGSSVLRVGSSGLRVGSSVGFFGGLATTRSEKDGANGQLGKALHVVLLAGGLART